jgi:glutathione peroxidase
MTTEILQIPCDTIDNRRIRLADYPAKAYLIANTASKCGFTPQYEGLESLWQTYGKQGLQVLGFPCNQFGAQEPGTEADISDFCTMNYGISFPLFKKIEVNGKDCHPLFAALKTAAPGLLGSEAIKWNFTKFLVDGRGEVIMRFAPATEPKALIPDIEALLR